MSIGLRLGHALRSLWEALALDHVHLVRAERTAERWPKADEERLEAFHNCHTLPDCGHWLHVDRPDALVSLLLRHSSL